MNHSDNPGLDALDRRILSELQIDCTLTHEALAERVHSSAPTCLRRVRRLLASGVIERRIAILDTARLGAGLTAIVEVNLERQSAELWEDFERRIAADAAVQQCYRVASGPDFVLVVWAADMPAYHAFVHRALTHDANVRNVRAYFSVKRSKFEPAVAV
jgi:Lrp/AsnC family leucine-responsive transcriptional regulator